MSENNASNPMRHPDGPWSPLQQLHRNSHTIASSATQHIQDLQYYVVQGLSPLITSASLRPVNNIPRYNRIRTRNSMEFMPPPSEVPPQAEAPPEPQHFVIDISDQELPEDAPINNTIHDAGAPEPSQQQQQQQSNDRPTVGMDVLRSTPEFQLFMSFTEKYIPFILILLLKLIFDHKLGILVIIGLFVTFFHANIVVKREVSRQVNGKRHVMGLAWVFLNLVICIVILYTVLAEKGLVFALIFVTPYTASVTVWDVLWVVSVTDFVIRMLTVLVKVFIIAIPAKLVAFHKKGKYYLFVERTSQLYRTIAPMQHWLYFFSESYTGPSKVFGVFLSAAYLIFKCKGILHRAKTWKRTLIKVLQSKTYGVAPSVSQIKEAGDACPICQDDYKSPSMLQCKHIFCEDCVALWFDRERTCPICRAQIADDPSWRDGATSLAFQIF